MKTPANLLSDLELPGPPGAQFTAAKVSGFGFGFWQPKRSEVETHAPYLRGGGTRSPPKFNFLLIAGLGS